jgi:hypothetical protein
MTTLTLASDARVIAIVGETDSGKTALMRGLRYLFLLDPAYPRTGENSMIVSTAFGEHRATRATSFKDGAKDLDTLTFTGEEPWTKFHRENPEGYTNKTGIFNLDIEDLDSKICLNFIGQMDRALPLELHPSQISKLFGSISGRNAVDSAIKESNLEAKRLQDGINDAQNSVDAAEAKLKRLLERKPKVDPKTYESILDDLDALDEIEESLSSLEAIEKSIRRIEKAGLGKERSKEIRQNVAIMGDELEDLKEINALGLQLRDVPVMTPFKLDAAMVQHYEDEMAKLSETSMWITDLEYCEVHLEEEGEAQKKAAEAERAAVNDTRTFLEKHKLCPYSGETLPERCKKSLIGA